MTGAQLTTLIRKDTHTNSTTYPDADLLVDINLSKDELASRIQVARKDVWKIPFLDDLVVNQREYAFPADLMNSMDYLELKFSSSADYVLAKPMQRHHYKDVLQESVIVSNFDNLEPRYFVRRKAIYILSGTIASLSDGIRLVAQVFPADLAALTGSTDLSVDPSTTTHGFPREFHVLWARLVSIKYKDRNSVRLSALESKFDIDLEKAIDEFSIPVLDEVIVGKLPSSADRGNNGYDY